MTSKDKSRPSKSRRRAAGRPRPRGLRIFRASSRSTRFQTPGFRSQYRRTPPSAPPSQREPASSRSNRSRRILRSTRKAKRNSGSLERSGRASCRPASSRLEPFESEINAEVAADFAAEVKKSAPRRGRAQGTEAVDDLSQSFAAQLDAPDPIVDGRMDVGALIEEFLILSLDPYPRKPGVRFEGAEFSSNPDAAESPFSVLKKLKDGE